MQIQNVYIIPILNILVSSIPNPIRIPVSTNQRLRPAETWIWTPPVPRGPCGISTLSLKIEAYPSQKKKKHVPPHVVPCTPGTKWPVVSSDKFLGRSVSSSLSLPLIHPAGLNLVKPNWKVDLIYLHWNSSSIDLSGNLSLFFLQALSQAQTLLWPSSQGCSRDMQGWGQ